MYCGNVQGQTSLVERTEFRVTGFCHHKLFLIHEALRDAKRTLDIGYIYPIEAGTRNRRSFILQTFNACNDALATLQNKKMIVDKKMYTYRFFMTSSST